MVISLAALALGTLLSFAIRQILIRKNNELDADEKVALDGANLVMVSEAARLEGMTLDQAMERRKGYRYLY